MDASEQAARLKAASAREAAGEAAAAVLEQSTAIMLAAEELLTHPRLAGDWDPGTGPGMSSAEVEMELRFALGVANRAPAAYVASLPPVGDLARVIGLRS